MGQRQMADLLGISTVIVHRLVNAIQGKDPLATAHMIPGPQPLRKVIKAARRHGVPVRLARDAEHAVKAFEAIIREEGGDRSGLDAIAGDVIPEVRARYESLAKQSVYRGMRQIKGVCAELTFNSVILHPSDDERWWDQILVTGILGVRRVRPGARLVLGRMSRMSASTTNHNRPRTLEGAPVEDQGGVVLHSFCAGPAVELSVLRRGEDAVYLLEWGDAVGETSARDVVLCERRRHALRRWRTADDSRTKSGFIDDICIPSKKHICDIFLHRDAYPLWRPGVRVLECGAYGYAEVNDASRDADVLDVDERVDSLGTGLERARAVNVPRYHDLMVYVFRKAVCDPQEFRLCRTLVDYPIVGSQLQYAFDVPLCTEDPRDPAPARGR